MATGLARVTVKPIHGGFAVACTHCDLHELLLFRHEADELAVGHQRSHVGGTRLTQHTWAGLR